MKDKTWYANTAKGIHPHRIKFTVLPRTVQALFATEREAEVFRDECRACIFAIKVMIKKKELTTRNLKARMSDPDWETVCITLKKMGVVIPAEVKDQLAHRGDNYVADVNVENPTVTELIDLYEAHKKATDSPLNPKDMRRFDYWRNDAGIKNMRCKELNAQSVRKERNKFAETHKPGTANGYKTGLSVAYGYLMEKYPTAYPYNVVLQVKEVTNDEVVHTETYLPQEALDLNEMAYEVDRVARRDVNAKGVMNHVTFLFCGPIFTVFLETGIRNSFLTSLHLDDLKDMDGDMPYIYKKMKRNRWVPVHLTDLALEVINKQLALPEVQECGYLFPIMDRHGKNPKMVKYWSSRFFRKIKQYGLTYTSMPIHSCRAYTATRLHELGFSDDVIADMLGIDKESVKKYVNPTNLAMKPAMDALNKDRKRVNKYGLKVVKTAPNSGLATL